MGQLECLHDMAAGFPRREGSKGESKEGSARVLGPRAAASAACSLEESQEGNQDTCRERGLGSTL